MATYQDANGRTYASIDLEWDQPSPLELDIVRWSVEWSLDGTDWETMTVDGRTNTSCVVTGLATGTDYYFRVRAVNRAGNLSPYADFNAGAAITMSEDTDPVTDASATLAFDSLRRSIRIRWTEPTEADYSHATVWRNSVGDWSGATLVGQGVNAYVDDVGGLDKSFYYNIKQYDEAGNETVGSNLNWILANTDVTPPDAPTALSVSSGTVLDADGKVIPYLDVSWTDSTSDDVQGHELEFEFDIGGDSYATSNPETQSAESPMRRMGVPGGVAYRVRCRAVDDAQLKSSWTTYQSGTTPKDNVAPGQPTISVTGIKGAVRVEVTSEMPDDWAECRYYIRTGADPSTSATYLRHTGRTKSFEWDTGTYYSTVYARVTVVDSSGNVSTVSSLSNGTPQQQSSSDLGSGSVGNTQVSNGGLSAIKILMSSQTLNAILSGDYIDWAGITNVSIQTADIGNAQITNAKIANATIESAKIADLSADKITAGTISATVSLSTTDTITFLNGPSIYGQGGGLSIAGGLACSNFRVVNTAYLASGQLSGDPDLVISSSVTGGSSLEVADSDKLDGKSAGNANGNIPVSNGTVCTNLNADMLDGQHASAFYESGDDPTFGDVTATTCSLVTHGGGAFPSTQVRVSGELVRLTSVESPAFLFLDVHDDVDERLLEMTEGDVYVSPLYKWKGEATRLDGKPDKFLVLAAREGYGDVRFAPVCERECGK